MNHPPNGQTHSSFLSCFDFRSLRAVSLSLCALLVLACGDNDAPAGQPDAGQSPDAAVDSPDGGFVDTYPWKLPPNLPRPFVPEDNPMTVEKVELGRHLFFDKRLSGNQTQSCEGCHFQELAFSDGTALPNGSTGDLVPRNAPPLMNVAYHSTLTWTNPNLFHLEKQILIPIFAEVPVELGVTGMEDEVLARFQGDELYQELFAEAYPNEEEPITWENLVKGLSSFVRSMVSFESDYDRYTYWGVDEAMTEGAKRGRDLFFEERLECHHCHGGFHFSLNTRTENTVFLERGFANNGLYNLDEFGAYPLPNSGLADFTGNPADNGKLRSSSLRNIALTAPYMHDGSIATLDDVLDMYAAGGNVILEGPNAGDGRLNPNKSEFIHGFELSEQERSDMLEFFDSLTDEVFVSDPAFSNPFEE